MLGMPIRVAIVDDFEVVVRGLAEMLRPFAGEIELVPLDSRLALDVEVDVALYDASSHADGVGLADLVDHPRVRRVVLYSWALDRAVVEDALQRGAAAYVSKTASADELVATLRTVHAGEPVAQTDLDGPTTGGAEDSWPGREQGLTAREAEVIALITQGLSNQEIAERASLSINSVKSYIRTSYRKMGVTSRTNAVLWGLDHGFGPDRGRAREGADAT
jgi:NarL family two-component system response regulator LiaR